METFKLTVNVSIKFSTNIRFNDIVNKEKLDFYKSVAAGLLQAPKRSPSMTVNHRVCATSKHLTWTARRTLKSDRWLYLLLNFLLRD